MKKIVLLLVTLLTNLISSLQAVEVKQGIEITEVLRAMSNAGYKKTELAIEPVERTHRLSFWSVDKGVLIVLYSEQSKKIKNISFWLSDGRSKAVRKTFDLAVKSFDTNTGEMVIKTKKEQAASGQHR